MLATGIFVSPRSIRHASVTHAWRVVACAANLEPQIGRPKPSPRRKIFDDCEVTRIAWLYTGTKSTLPVSEDTIVLDALEMKQKNRSKRNVASESAATHRPQPRNTVESSVATPPQRTMEAVATMDNVWSQSRNLIGKNMLVKAGVCPKHTDIQLCKMPMMAEWRVYVDPCPRCVANAPASTASKNLLDPPILAHLPSNATMNIDTGACAFHPGEKWATKIYSHGGLLWAWKVGQNTCRHCAK
jgi:hypothetical protein